MYEDLVWYSEDIRLKRDVPSCMSRSYNHNDDDRGHDYYEYYYYDYTAAVLDMPCLLRRSAAVCKTVGKLHPEPRL